MVEPAYTEEDLKKLLKQLVFEKKRAQALEQKLQESDPSLPQKFHSKLLQKRDGALVAECEQLRLQLVDKEDAIVNLHKQLNKAKPALKQLLEQLQEAQARIKEYENQPVAQPQAWEEHQKQLHAALAEVTQAKKDKDEGVHALHQELDKMREGHQREVQRFENERARLVEKMADSLSQHQRQHEIVKDLHEEINRLRQSNQDLKQHLEKGQVNLEGLMEHKRNDADHIRELEKSNEGEREARVLLQQRLTVLEEQLASSDVAAIHRDYAVTLQTQREELSVHMQRMEAERDAAMQRLTTLEKSHEETVEASYAQLQELNRKIASMTAESLKVEDECKRLQEQLVHWQKEASTSQAACREAEQIGVERLQEIRQAQQHLAKKVKEATLLRDMTEEQKIKLAQYDEEHTRTLADMQQLKQGHQLQKMHEEKLQMLVEEWQDKFREQTQELQSSKYELGQLQKVKKQYDELSTAVIDIKNTLGRYTL